MQSPLARNLPYSGAEAVGPSRRATGAGLAKIGSAYPTAGGLYHWSSILGGRGWGWATAWINLIGLVELSVRLACLTSTSRMIDAFSRDGGLPGSTPWKTISQEWLTPVPAIWR